MVSDGLFSGRIEARLAALEARIAALERRGRPVPTAPIDGIGAPLEAGSWPVLRDAVKQTIAELGLDEAARRYGASPETFRDVVYRRREPGAGTRARLSVVAGGKFDGPD